MEKVASKQTAQSNKGEEMNKQASDAGKALAQALLKMAGVGDESTSNGIPAGVVPNKTQVDLAQQRAEHDNSFQATPGTDGAGNGGTINQIFDAIVADAMGATNAKDEQETGNTAHAEGAIARQAPAQVQVNGPAAIGGEDQEKAAAVSALVESGYDFEESVNLVKAASDELDFEHDQHIKQAALNELIDSGVDFDYAVSMVKEAGAGALATRLGRRATVAGGRAGQAVGGAGKRLMADAKEIPSQVRGLGTAPRMASSALGRNTAVRAAAGTAVVGTGAYALGREKKAAVDGLIEAGVDFDTAVNLVNAKADELYGY
jgi:hypothetical protein